MTEYFTEALVLDAENSGELDKSIYLYTEKLGRITAKAKSIRKITSKLAAHLQPLNFVQVRLVEKNGFQVVDAIIFERAKPSQAALSLIQFIKEMTFEFQPDKKFWLLAKKAFREIKDGKKISYRPLIGALGFEPAFARCNLCGGKYPIYFSKTEQVFLCRRCGFRYGMPSGAGQENFSDLIQI